MKRLMLVISLLLLLTACTTAAETEPEANTAVTQPNTAQTENARPTPTNAPPPQPSPSAVAGATEIPVVESADTAVPDLPTATPEVIDPVTDLTIVADDGTAIATTLYLPEGDGPFPGVVLLHMLGSQRQEWEKQGMTQTLIGAGYAVIAVDMRGHGETVGNRDWALIREDIFTVWDDFTDLETVSGGHTAVIGASIGSNVALQVSAANPAIRTAILLSPGLDYRGVTTDDHVVSYGDRPLLIVASEEDGYAADSSRTLEELAKNGRLLMLQDSGHGTNMLFREDLQAEIVAWLDANLK